MTLPREFVCHAMRDLVGWKDALSTELAGLPIEDGTFRSYLPPQLELADRTDIGWYHAELKASREDSRSHVISHILRFLEHSESAVALFASMSHEGEEGLDRLRTPHFLVPDPSVARDALWHRLSRMDADEETVETALEEMRAFTGLVVLTTLPKGLSLLSPGERATADEIAGLSKNTEFLVGEAFDGDGYLIWEPPQRPGEN